MVCSNDLLESVGVNCHFETLALNNDPKTMNVLTSLMGSGIRHLRTPIFKIDSADDWWTDRHHQILASLTGAGIKLTALHNWEPRPGVDAARFATAEQLAVICDTTYSGKVAAFEGPNEPDNPAVNPGAPSDWRKYTLESLVALRQARDKRPGLRDIPIIGPSPIGGATQRQYLGPIDFLVDGVNTHPYTGNQVATQAFIAQHFVDAVPSCPCEERPLYATEHGISTFGDPWPAVTEREQAILTIRQVLAHAKAGIRRSFYYDFIDDGVVASRESTFGLLKYDTTPKVSYTALSKLLNLCDANSCPEAPLTWNLTDSPPDARTLVLTNSDDTHLFIAWREAPIGTAAVTAKLSFPGKSHKTSYDLIDGAPDCPADFPDGFAFDVVLSDAPVVIRV